ncbi:MAG TPA: MBL fold metallo-hydrolase [Treponemataceae bacterium]|nr:MBL fold metallo-hydrolase [Treponemataceae bacterium]
MSVTLYSLGAAEEVTGSKHIFEVDGKSYMVDCGAFQGRRKESDEKNRKFDFPVENLEAVILTHAHYDHCGLLPVLTKNGFTKNIYATPATRDLANLVLMDSAHIQARDAQYLRKQAKKRGEVFTWQPLFDQHDVVNTTNQMITVSYNREVFIGPNVKIEFFDAGHILGSAMILVTIINAKEKADESGSRDVRILYTGDLGRCGKAIIRDPAIDMPAPDYIILESTYGNRKHESTDVAIEELRKAAQYAFDRKGKVIIPAFAIERTQEIVFYLHLLVDKGRLPKVPIYVDSPMATNATSIFRVHQECYDDETRQVFLDHHKNPFGFNELTFTTNVEESKNLNNIDGPMIIISADGMCEFGRIVHHVANNISNPNNTVLIVGYMAENTLGRRLRDGEKEVRIFGDWHAVKARVETVNAFSAHADYTEMLTWLNNIDNTKLKKIFLVHGEEKAQLYFTQYLWDHNYTSVEVVKYGKTYEI